MEAGCVLSTCLVGGTQCSVQGRQNQAQQPGLVGSCSLWRPGTHGLAEPWGLHLCANAGSCLGPGACWTQLLRLRQSPPPMCGLEFQPGVCGQLRGPRPTPRGRGWPRGETTALFVTGFVAEFCAPFRLHLVEQPCLQVSFLLKVEFPRGQGPVGGARRSCPGVSAGVGAFQRWWHAPFHQLSRWPGRLRRGGCQAPTCLLVSRESLQPFSQVTCVSKTVVGND